MQRTVRLDLAPTVEQAALLFETMRQQTKCFNEVATIGWEHGESSGRRLHQETYAAQRARFPLLPSQLVCAARVRAAESVRSALTLKRQGRRTSCPRSVLVPIRYDARSYRPDIDHGFFSLATVAGRQKVAFRSNPHAEKWLSRATGFDSADLKHVDGRYRLHVVVTVEASAFEPSGDVVGVDLGLCHPAVTSDNLFLGRRRWRAIEQRYFKLKRSLQAKGTSSAKRHLRRIRERVERFRRDCDHALSKHIVECAGRGTVIAIEDLTGIQNDTRRHTRQDRRRMHSWSYSRLRGFIEYKAEDRGCLVEAVEAKYTSQRCSRCGHTERANRRSQARFCCRACGFELNADLNAARNIAWKYRTGGASGVARGLPVNQPIVGIEYQPSFTRKLSPSVDGS